MPETILPDIILVRPQMGENIGAAARAMLNFGLDRMSVVAPRDGWPSGPAAAMASGAGRVLDGARLFDDVGTAVADLSYVYATTARLRGLTKAVMTPETAMADAAARVARGERVGVLFGPERAGLENDDLLAAQAIVTVPVNPDFPSLNLAQCVLLVAYEWARATGAAPPADDAPRPATREEVARLLERLDNRLQDAGFFFPADKAEPMRTTLHNLFFRLDLTEPDIRVLHGVVKILGRDLSDT